MPAPGPSRPGVKPAEKGKVLMCGFRLATIPLDVPRRSAPTDGSGTDPGRLRNLLCPPTRGFRARRVGATVGSVSGHEGPLG
jgi:hypothetical protein